MSEQPIAFPNNNFPMNFNHPTGLEMTIDVDENGAFLLTAHNPATGRTLYGTEPDLDGAKGWISGLRLALLPAKGSA